MIEKIIATVDRLQLCIDRTTCICIMCIKGVVPGGAMATPDFGRSVNPISHQGGRLCPPNNTGTPGFSDLPTALCIDRVNKLREVQCFFFDNALIGI